MKFRLSVALFLLGCVSFSASAITPAEKQMELLKKDHHIVNIDGANDNSSDTISEQELIEIFYYDQFRHFQDPRAPYFLLMSKTKKSAMGIGGVVRMV